MCDGICYVEYFSLYKALEGVMNAVWYNNEVFEQFVVPFAESLVANFIFMFANACFHRARGVKQYLVHHGIK